MAIHEMLFMQRNADVPRGVLTSTARKGTKWREALRQGDVLNLTITETGAAFARAVVTATELVTLRDVLRRALENHVGQATAKGTALVQGAPMITAAQEEEAARALRNAIEAAYGPLSLNEPFTLVQFIVVNDP